MATSHAIKIGAGLVVLGLAACNQAQADDPIELETIEAATENPDEGTVEVGETGDIEAEVGQTSGLSADGTSIFDITVTDLEFSQTCPSRLDGSELRAEGTFLIAHVEASLASDFADHIDEGAEFMPLAPDAFLISSSDNLIQDGVMSAAAHECFSLEDLIAPVIYPGESESGLVVFDIDIDHGYLTYNPWGAPGSGWRWEF